MGMRGVHPGWERHVGLLAWYWCMRQPQRGSGCRQCGRCWAYCPDLAIFRTGQGTYEVDARLCKGCGICAEECPNHNITMKGVTP